MAINKDRITHLESVHLLLEKELTAALKRNASEYELALIKKKKLHVKDLIHDVIARQRK